MEWPYDYSKGFASAEGERIGTLNKSQADSTTPAPGPGPGIGAPTPAIAIGVPAIVLLASPAAIAPRPRGAFALKFHRRVLTIRPAYVLDVPGGSISVLPARRVRVLPLRVTDLYV